MSIAAGTLTWEALISAIAEAGTYATLQEAIDAGVVIVGENAVTGLAVVEGGAAVATSSLTGTALELANASELAATGARVSSAGATLLAGQSGFSLAGMMSLNVGLVSTIAAPLAGVNLGANLYEANPALWTKISQAVLPFCYAENKVQAFLDYVVDTATGQRKPVVLVAKAIVDALKQLFDDEVELRQRVTVTDSQGNSLVGITPSGLYGDSLVDRTTGSPVAYGYGSVEPSGFYLTGGSFYLKNGREFLPGIFYGGPVADTFAPWNKVKDKELLRILRNISGEPEITPPTAGVSAPSTPVEPIVWPNSPIIIVPDPVGPDYQPIPVTPVTPMFPPTPETPLLPEHAPDPTPESPPEEWPDEEPWPTTIPFPLQPTEPTPDWPEVMPWPLPANPPSEWPLSPETPEKWPEEFPSTEPWPRSPEQWPEEVPWPDQAPEDWPEGVPWPESPEEWPEEVPWPVPWPENWPETAPWPIKWPDELPYPWPFPYPFPSPSQDPYPDPQTLDDPTKQVDPYIDPWPYQWPDPYPSPTPKPDP